MTLWASANENTHKDRYKKTDIDTLHMINQNDMETVKIVHMKKKTKNTILAISKICIEYNRLKLIEIENMP